MPNETRELYKPDPELCEQSNLSTDDSQVSTSVPQPPVNFSDEDNESNSSVDEEHVHASLPVVLRRLGKIRKPVVRLEL